MTDAILQSAQLEKHFNVGRADEVRVLNGVNFSVAPGETVAIVGTSGSGKTTLLQLLGGLAKPTSGDVLIDTVNVNTLSPTQKGKLRNQKLGFVYQFHHLLPEFDATENVAMPLLIAGESPKSASTKAKAMLEKVGLAERLKHRISELSGGERQRVAIARALVTSPVCVLADEPTGNLDKDTANAVIDLMLSLREHLNTSFVIVTHDLELAARCDRQLKLQGGLLMSSHSPAT